MIQRYLSPRELSELVGIRETTLCVWRHRDAKEPPAKARGPRFTKLGRLVRYAESDVREWIARRDVRSAAK